jgi:hypothetical protein
LPPTSTSSNIPSADQQGQPQHTQQVDTTTNDGNYIFTNSTPTLQELHTIIKAMCSNASPGLDGLNAGFYKSAWPWISKDVHKLVSDFYATTAMD